MARIRKLSNCSYVLQRIAVLKMNEDTDDKIFNKVFTINTSIICNEHSLEIFLNLQNSFFLNGS